MANYGNLLIFGAGGYGQVVKELAVETGKFNKIEFIDDNNPLAISKVSESEKYLKEFSCAIIAIGNPEVRQKIYNEIKQIGFEIVNIMSDKSYVSSSAKIGKGCVIEPFVTVNANSTIGNSVILCAGSVVGHNSVVDDFCQIDYNGVVSVNASVPAKTKICASTVYLK